jgi:hypothetical protein
MYTGESANVREAKSKIDQWQRRKVGLTIFRISVFKEASSIGLQQQYSSGGPLNR